MARAAERNIPHLWDIFGLSATKSQQDSGDSASTGGGGQTDSAISVGSTSDEDFDDKANKQKAKHKRNRIRSNQHQHQQQEMKYLERHLSMKKTISKKIMRDLQKAFVEDPNEFRVEDIPPEQLKAQINLQSLTFAPSGRKIAAAGAGGGGKGKRGEDSNFLDFLRGNSTPADGGGDGGGVGKNCAVAAVGASRGWNKETRRDVDGDSGHGSPTFRREWRGLGSGGGGGDGGSDSNAEYDNERGSRDRLHHHHGGNHHQQHHRDQEGKSNNVSPTTTTSTSFWRRFTLMKGTKKSK